MQIRYALLLCVHGIFLPLSLDFIHQSGDSHYWTQVHLSKTAIPGRKKSFWLILLGEKQTGIPFIYRQTPTCTCQGPAASVDVNNAALEAFISLGRRFKYSHFHAVKNCIRDFDVFRGHRLQLVEGANQIIQDYQVMAESQIVNQVTLMGGKEEGKKFLLFRAYHRLPRWCVIQLPSNSRSCMVLKTYTGKWNFIKNL